MVAAAKKRTVERKRSGYISNMIHNPWLYVMALPVIAYYIIFHYLPMYGVVIAFKDYVPARGIWESGWVGFKHFQTFFSSTYFPRLLRNTLAINLKELLFSFPIPIVFAILLNEVRSTRFRRISQSITYMPHFVSTVVICGLLVDFTKSTGVLTNLFVALGMDRINMLSVPEYFQGIFIGGIVWQSFGWDSIIYFAALTGIDPALYDAARVDGAGRFKQILHVTLPGIAPTIVVLMLLRIGSMMSVSWDRIVLLYNPLTYETADVLSSYVYRIGLTKMQYSFATAVGLFNSGINILLLVAANTISRRVSENSLW
ncbi:MAG: ABC transporter permease subunit [Candidatus Limiplasma sp.]|nr:ABC transporter permease subunit [Candidatus Limiplasma sp.]